MEKMKMERMVERGIVHLTMTETGIETGIATGEHPW